MPYRDQATAEIVILSNNMLEAADLEEVCSERGLGRIRHIRRAREAIRESESRSTPIKLVFFGLTSADPDFSECLSHVLELGTPIIYLEGAAAEIHAKTGRDTVVLARPFTTNDVLKALDSVDEET